MRLHLLLHAGNPLPTGLDSLEQASDKAIFAVGQTDPHVEAQFHEKLCATVTFGIMLNA